MNTAIDRSTRDYTVSSTGGLTAAPEHENAVLIALATHKGTVPGEPDMGSELHLLRKGTVNVAQLEDVVLRALRPLLDEGVLTRATVSRIQIERDSGRASFTLEYVAGGSQHTFTHFVRIA